MDSFNKNLIKKIFLSPYKSLLIFIALILLFEITGNYFLSYKIIIPAFSELEREKAQKDLNRIKNAIQREVFHLMQISKDWAYWDDTYKYVKEKDKAYEISNFQWESLNASGIELIFICSNNGRTIWHGIHDKILNKNIQLKRFSKNFCSSDPLIKLFKKKGGISGIISTENGPLLITLQQILKSSGKGPSRGIFVMGRFLHKNIIQTLSKQMNIHFTLMDLTKKNIPEKERKIAKKVLLKHYIFIEKNNNILLGYTIVRDINKKPLLLIKAKFTRDIMLRGLSTAKLVTLSVVTTFTIIFIFIALWIVLFRIETNRRRKKIEKLVQLKTKQLKENEERLRTLINATPDIICFKDGEGRWVEANKADLELFQLTNVDYRGKTDLELANYTHPVFKEAFKTCYQSDEKAWKNKTLIRNEETIPTIDGGKKIFDVIKVPLFHLDGSRKALIVFGRDITQEKILGKKLIRAEKMEAIGLMASGVAHDLNNILSTILGYPDLILMKLPDDSPVRKYVEAIKRSGEKASEIVMDLLTIARGVSAKKEIASLNDIIKEYIDSDEFKNFFKDHLNVSVELNLEKDLLNIYCSPVHIKKSLMNLVHNAAESIKGKGKIIISTRNQYVDKPLPKNQFLKKGEYVVLSISDTGEGIPEEYIDRIFEPFFSKKKATKKSGTGLGLAVVWNTVHDHDGGIKVSSDKNGTTFELFFPATRKKLIREDTKEEINKLKGNGEKILIVDDEEEQLEIYSSLLTMLNYKVFTCKSGEDAIFFLNKNKIEIVIIDLVMEPGISGFETLKIILEKYPHQKAIIMSGFYSENNIDNALKLGAKKFLKKPLTLKKIAIEIKEVLSEN